MRTYIFQSALALVLLLSSVTGVAAQTEGVDKYGNPLPTEEDLVSGAPVIADVLLYNLDMTAITDTELSGTFSIMGRMGQENDIIYGIAAYDDQGQFLGSQSAGQVKTLAQGEVQELSFTYVVPKNLSGQVTFMLVLENGDGMLLGFKEVWQNNFNNPASGISCDLSKDAAATAVCTDSVNGKVSLEVSSFSVFGERTPMGEGTIVAGQSATFSPEVPPGRYNLYVTTEAGEQVIVPIKKEGAYGSIMNAAVYKNVDGVTEATIPVFGSGLKDAKLEVSFTNEKGEVCYEKGEVLSLPVFIFSLPDSCQAGLLTATLTSADGTVFDTETEPYSTGPQAFTSTESASVEGGAPAASSAPESSSTILLVVVVIVLTAVAGYMAYRLKSTHVVSNNSSNSSTPNVPPTALALLFGIFALSIPFQSAHALMFAPYLYSTARGEFAWTATVNVTLDQASYTPGEVAVISASGMVMSDAGASTGATGNSYAYYYMNSANTYASFDAETTSGLITDIASVTGVPRDTPTSFSGNTTLTIPPTMTPGSHSVRFVRVTVSGGCFAQSGQPCNGDRDIDNSLGFTVVAPNAAPVAGAGTDRTITLPTTSVTISGATATDSDGTIASRSWTQRSGPVTATRTGATTLTPTFSNMTTAGTYVFRLTVTDNDGSTDFDEMQVVVLPTAPSCGWAATAYLGTNTGNPGMHNTTRCSTPAPSDGTPNNAYCDSGAENGTTVVCCDSGADCYRYTCNYGGSCTASVQLNFQ